MLGTALARLRGERVRPFGGNSERRPLLLRPLADPTGLWLGLGLTAVVWAVAAAQWPLRDLVAPWDSKNQFYVFFRFMADSIHHGATPFWNPYEYAGHPGIADPQSLVFAPAFVLWALVDPKPSLFAFDIMVFAHLLAGGLAIVVYGRRRGWTAPAAVLAAVVFMLGGAASGRLTHTGIITVYGLFPIAVLWMETALECASLLAAVGFGAVSAFIALGRSQVPLLLCVVLAVLLVRRLWSAPERLPFLRSRLPALFVAASVCGAIVAVPMLLTLQFADFSNRPEIGLETALRSSLYPLNFANFFAPDVFGSLRPLELGDWGPAYATRPAIDSTDRAFNYLFAGSLTALLLVWHGFAGGRVFARGRRAFAAIALLSVLYAIGRYSPVFPFLFEHAPGIDLFRRPVGATFILLLGLAYLIGDIANDYVRAGAPRAPRAAVAVVLALVVALMVWAVEFSSLSSKGREAAIQIVEAAAIYVVLIALLVGPKTERGRAIALALAVLFTSGELVARNTATPLNAEPRANYALLEAPTPQVARVLEAIHRDSRARAEPGVRPRVEIVGLGGPWQNAAMLYGLEATNGYNPLRIGPYDRLVEPGESTWEAIKRRFPSSFPGYDCLLSRLLGLEYLVLDRPIETLPNRPRKAEAVALLSGPDVWVYRLPHAAPRVTVESRVEVADAAALIDSGRFPISLPPSEVMVDADDHLTQRYLSLAVAKPAGARIVDWRADRVEIEVETRAPAILTLHDLWYPGWQAWVDGVEKPVLRTDLLFRGVEIPAGARKVVFAYRPLSLRNLRAALDLVLPGIE